MLDGFWAFLSDPGNREVLGWIGGGIVVVAGGAWAMVKFAAGEERRSVRADRGGVAIGRDNINSPIDTEPPGSRR
jgi:hypothetical protein